MTDSRDTLNHLLITSTDIESNTKVPCETLDSFTLKENCGYIDYLKIDVEGFEYNVLSGCKILLLNKKIGIIQLEINESINKANGQLDLLIRK